MHKFINNEFLYAHIPEAEKAIIEAIPDENKLDHVFSDRFENKMNKLVKYECRNRFSRVMTQIGKVAVIALLIVTLLNTILLFSVRAYRYRFIAIIKTVTEEFTSFLTKADTQEGAEFIPVEPQYIPLGFDIEEEFLDTKQFVIIYKNASGQYIGYTQEIVSDTLVAIDTENVEVKTLNVYGTDVYNIIKDETSQLFWVDGDYSFSIISDANSREILLFLESILTAKK